MKNESKETNMNKTFVVDSAPQSFKYRIFVMNALQNNDEMVDAVRVLENASELDTVHLYINTPGGRVDSALLLYNALLNTRYKTISQFSGYVASAGTMLMMAADELDIAPFTMFLFHTTSSMFRGKSSETKADIDFSHAWNEKLIRGVYGSLFNEDEYTELLVHGKDIRLNREEFMLKYTKLLEEQQPKTLTKTLLRKISKPVLIELILGEKRINAETGEIYDVNS